MTQSTTTSFPKGILMIGRFMLLSILSIISRYYDIRNHIFQIPDYHFINTTLDVLFIIGGLLLLSKKVEYVRIVPLIIGITLFCRVIMTIISGNMTSSRIIFIILGIALDVFFIIYILKQLNLYINKTTIAQ